MKKNIILILLILTTCIFSGEFEILEKDGELYFKYNESELLDEIKEVLENNKEILDENFSLSGEKKFKKTQKFGKDYIDKNNYSICQVETKIERCIYFINNEKKYYLEKNILNNNIIKKLSYENFGKNIKTFSTEKNVLWFKNNKLIEYVEYVKSEDGENLGTITYIFDKKDNLEKIKVLNSIWITVKLKEKEATTSSIGGENYYFTPEGKFMKKETYYKNTPRKE